MARRRQELARRRRILRRLLWAACVVAVVALVTQVASGSGGHGTKRGRPASRDARRPPPKPPPPALLPRGGRILLPGNLIVAYYGIVGTSNILGQTSDPEADAAGVERQAGAYAHFGRPVLPAFELVTTIASSKPGQDGNYSSAIDWPTLRRYLKVAHQHKLLVILDFQPGRGEFLPEVRRYARLLLDPAVGVALDPEWKLSPYEFPDQAIGSSSAASINAVSDYLSGVVTRHRLPQKLFIVHEFQTSELPDRPRVAIRPGLATVLQMDGLGAVSTKLGSYRAVMRGASAFHPGFKVFLRSVDDPVRLSPEQIMGLRPQPEYVSYQ